MDKTPKMEPMLADDLLVTAYAEAYRDNPVGSHIAGIHAVAALMAQELAKQQEPVVIEAPDYRDEAMGCGLEDRNITDRYEAMRYGWECAVERIFSQIPDEPLYTRPTIPQPAAEPKCFDAAQLASIENAVREGCGPATAAKVHAMLSAAPAAPAADDRRIRRLKAALASLLEVVDEPPDANCSCHLSPPCNDCIDYSHIREALSDARAVLAEEQAMNLASTDNPRLAIDAAMAASREGPRVSD